MTSRDAASSKETVAALLREHGTTHAAEAGITLRDKPSPLYQLLVLTTLSASRISAGIAVRATRELLAAGWRTPARMRDATWQERVDALGRGGYRRFDESTATTLDAGARWLLETHRGDLRRLRPANHDDLGDDLAGLREALTDAPGVGPAGAAIFCREVQAVWPEVRPFFDERGRRAARRLGLPSSPEGLASLVPADRVADLSAALVRAPTDAT